MPVSGKLRSTQGCWTCRLRRKKCGEQKPACSICAALEITCLYSDKKPDWADGGEREKEMAEQLKVMVKLKASERRERNWASIMTSAAQSKGVDSSSGDSDITLSQDVATNISDSRTKHGIDDMSDVSSRTLRMSAADDSGPDLVPTKTRVLVANTQPPGPSSEPILNSDHAGASATRYPMKTFTHSQAETELNFSMVYLDYVVPYMFPFYRPPLLQGGRGWLLVLLMRNKPLYHTALSLASYFFSLMIGKTLLGHEDCISRNWSELQKQQGLSLKALQTSMECMTSTGVATSLHESVQCLEGIIQLVSFDVTIHNASSWQMHYKAASSLFRQIVEHHGTDKTRPWHSILTAMDTRDIGIEFLYGQYPWSADQASWRFLTVNLLWTDILASTASDNAPQLDAFHQQLLVGARPDLRFSDFFGCHNWAMLIIGQIAMLNAWKKEMRRSSTLSVVELVKKGSCIETRLRTGVEELGIVPMSMFHDPSARMPDEPFAGSGFETITEIGMLQTTPAQALHTMIWAKAALTYVLVVVSGFQPALPDIQTNVAETMDLFRMMRSPLCLRTLIWPFAITGCLCLPDQEDFFRALASDMGTMQVFGTVKEAVAVMSNVWDHRSCLDAGIWDIATCLNLLGHSSLLV